MSDYIFLSPDERVWKDSDRRFGNVLREILAPAAAAGGAASAAPAASLLNAALNKPGPMINEDEGGYEEPAAGPVQKIPAGVELLDIGFSNANANAGLATVDRLNDAISKKNVKNLSRLLLAGARVTPDFLAILYANWKSFTPTELKFCVALMEWLSDRLPAAFRTKIVLPGGGYFRGARNVPADGMVDAGFFLEIIGNNELSGKFLEYGSMQLLLSGEYNEYELIKSIRRACRDGLQEYAKLAISKFIGEIEGAEKVRRIRLLMPIVSECNKTIQTLFQAMSRVGGARKRRSTHRKNTKTTQRNRKATRSRR